MSANTTPAAPCAPLSARPQTTEKLGKTALTTSRHCASGKLPHPLFLMPDPCVFDLAQPEAWCGFRPGMSRAEAMAGLQRLGAEVDGHGEENLAAQVHGREMEFWFATDGSERLRQLSVEAEEIHWNGQPLLDARVDDALRALEPHGPALWEPHDAIGLPFRAPSAAPQTPPTDEELLSEGTIWLPERGLGLVICEGAVIGVAWREARDLPAQFAGPVTEAQRALSRRPDLEDYLRGKQAAEIRVEQRKNPLRLLRGAVTVLAFVALAMIGRRGFEDTRLWAQAPALPGKLLAFERGPRKEFRDYLPPPFSKLIPAGKRVDTDLYRVEFLDPAGVRREAVLEPAEFYVSPQEIGEEVQVIYAEGEPPRVHGPSRARDAAFIDYVPWAICVGALWLLAQILIGVLPRLLPLLRGLVPKATVSDPERPELR